MQPARQLFLFTPLYEAADRWLTVYHPHHKSALGAARYNPARNLASSKCAGDANQRHASVAPSLTRTNGHAQPFIPDYNRDEMNQTAGFELFRRHSQSEVLLSNGNIYTFCVLNHILP